MAMDLEGSCPYCGEVIEVTVDEGGGQAQRYVEDCSVCCRPIDVRVTFDDDGEPGLALRRLDE